MAGEIIKTQGIVLAVSPWSRTSHVVTWLTPDHGTVSTLVKGAVRPKSAFLGQYDLFYACELLYYAHASGALHAIREVAPVKLREHLRADWRAAALAGHAAFLARACVPPGAESEAWYRFLDDYLESLAAPATRPAEFHLRALVALETRALALAGLAPDFSGLDAAAPWTRFAIDRGRCGEGARTVRLAAATVRALERPDAAATPPDALRDAVRFLGLFLAYHVETPPDERRTLVSLLTQR